MRMRFRPGELQPIENWLTPATVLTLLETAGWKPLQTRYAFSFFPVAMSRHPWLRPLRFLAYDLLRLRGPLEASLEEKPIGDCTVILAHVPEDRDKRLSQEEERMAAAVTSDYAPSGRTPA